MLLGNTSGGVRLHFPLDRHDIGSDMRCYFQFAAAASGFA